MTDWSIKTLGEVCEFVSGSVTPKPGVKYQVFSVPSFDCGNPELLDGSEIKSSKRPVEPGDVLLCKINPRINRVWRVDRESKNQQIASTEWIALRCREYVLDVFLEYVLQAPSARTAMIESVTGATGSHTRAKFEIVEELEFPVPPLEEQKRIVALLDAVSARVTELTACYEQARTHANDLFSSALRDTLEVKQNVPVRSLDELCEEGIVKLGRGNIISKKDIAANPGSYPIYSSARENEGKFGEYGDYMFDEEMITWSIDGGGRLFYRPKHRFSVTNVGGTLRVLEPKRLDIQYLHRVLQNLHSQRVFDWVFKAHPSVIRKVYDEIPVPPLEEQKRIVTRLDAMRAKTSEMVTAYDAKLTAAKKLRQSILEAAFAGDL
jgi:type I restriction enzyme S subunit